MSKKNEYANSVIRIINGTSGAEIDVKNFINDNISHLQFDGFFIKNGVFNSYYKIDGSIVMIQTSDNFVIARLSNLDELQALKEKLLTDEMNGEIIIDRTIMQVNMGGDFNTILSSLNKYHQTTFLCFDDTKHHYYLIDNVLLLLTEGEKHKAEVTDLQNYFGAFKLWSQGEYFKFPVISDDSITGAITDFFKENKSMM